MLKIKFRFKYLLLVPVVLFIFWFTSFASSLALLVVTGAPLSSVPPYVLAFLQNTAMPIIMGRATLGIVLLDYPEAHAVYRNRREGLLGRVAILQPNRRVIAVIVLDRLYTPEEMEKIVDPTQLNIVGFAAFAPSYEPTGLTTGGGLSLTSFPQRLIPSDASSELAVKRWQDLRPQWEENIAIWQDNAKRSQKRLETLKAGEIPPGYRIMMVINGEQVDFFADPRILKMTPSERLQDEHFRQVIAREEKSTLHDKARAKWRREHFQKDVGIYSVTVEGPAGKINELRRRPEISIVDPMLFPGILGTITTWGINPLLVIEFHPTNPVAVWR